MLMNPSTLIEQPIGVAGVVLIIMIGKTLAALGIALLAKLPIATGMLIAASLAQIGEFSFVLAGIGQKLGIVTHPTYNLIMAGALISIALNPFLFRLAEAAGKKLTKPEAPAPGVA
jgi:CPA2 family monovalent cation:H+ antiporter-2